MHDGRSARRVRSKAFYFFVSYAPAPVTSGDAEAEDLEPDKDVEEFHSDLIRAVAGLSGSLVPSSLGYLDATDRGGPDMARALQRSHCFVPLITPATSPTDTAAASGLPSRPAPAAAPASRCCGHPSPPPRSRSPSTWTCRSPADRWHRCRSRPRRCAATPRVVCTACGSTPGLGLLRPVRPQDRPVHRPGRPSNTRTRPWRGRVRRSQRAGRVRHRLLASAGHRRARPGHEPPATGPQRHQVRS